MPRIDRDTALASDLDACLDRLVAGVHDLSPTQEETATLAATQRRLAAMAEADERPALAASVPLWPAVASRASHRPVANPPPLARLSDARDSSRGVGFGALSTAAVLLLIVAGGLMVFTAEDRLPTASDGPSVTLYRTDDDGYGLIPLDPVTLSDAPAPFGSTPDVATGAMEWDVSGYWLASADGSTLIAITPSAIVGAIASADVVVFTLPAGRERNRFQIESHAFGPKASLATDGSQLVVEVQEDGVLPVWTVYDTSDGHVRQTIAAELPMPAPMTTSAAIDPSGTRLFALSLTTADQFMQPGLWPLRLTVFDLASGLEERRIDLPDVTAGHWLDQGAGSGPSDVTTHSFIPALAMSPDGKRLAIVAGAGSSVTIVDTARLVVERRIDVPIGEIATSVSTAAASADSNENLISLVAFHPDGRRVLVSTLAGTEAGDRACWRFSNLVADLVSGEVDEIGIGGLVFVPTQAAADDLYIWTRFERLPQDGCETWSRFNIQEPHGPTLWRLDAATLEPRATREFDSSVHVVVVPTGERTGAAG